MQGLVLYFIYEHFLTFAAMCMVAFRSRFMKFFDLVINVSRDMFVSAYSVVYLICGGMIASAIVASYMGKAAFGEFSAEHFNPLISMLLYELALFLIYIFDIFILNAIKKKKYFEYYRVRVTVFFKKVNEFVRRPKLVLLQ